MQCYFIMALPSKNVFITITIFFSATFRVLCYSDHDISLYSRNKGNNPGKFRSAHLKPGWIDPFDMLGKSVETDEPSSYPSTQIWSSLETDYGTKCNQVIKHILRKTPKGVDHEIMLRQFVNIFLNEVEKKEPHAFLSPITMVEMHFSLSDNDLKNLKHFGKNHESGPDVNIETVFKILSKMFTEKIYRERPFSIMTWIKKAFIKLIRTPELTVLISVSLLLFSTLWIVFKTDSYRLALFTAFLTIFFAALGFNWMRMYEEEEIRRFSNIQINGLIPYHCQNSMEMKWYEHMYYRMFGVDCYEFYKIRDVNPVVKISPADVLAETISSIFIKPALFVGKAYGNFITNVIESVPWYLKPMAVPLSFIVPLLFVIYLLALLFNYHLSITWFGFNLSPSWYQNQSTLHTHESKYIKELCHKVSETLHQTILSTNNLPMSSTTSKRVKNNIDEESSATPKVQSKITTKYKQTETDGSDYENTGNISDKEGSEDIVKGDPDLIVNKNSKNKAKTLHNIRQRHSLSSNCEVNEKLSVDKEKSPNVNSGDQLRLDFVGKGSKDKNT